MNVFPFENIKKRIILVMIGIVGYYTIPIPLGMLMHLVLRIELINDFGFYSIFQITTISFLIGFLYIAFVKVKPSLFPQQKKYRQMIVLSILTITILSIMIPGGLIVKDWKQGQCLIKSGTFNEDGMMSGTTSSGVGSELECILNCKFLGRVSMNEDKSCEFNGLFGSGHWVKTPQDFAGIEDKITWNG